MLHVNCIYISGNFFCSETIHDAPTQGFILSQETIKRVVLLGIFSFSLLAMEIVITRIFSVLFWYHFGFLVLSSAMLGFGAGGVLVRVLSNKLKKYNPDLIITIIVLLSGIALFFTMLYITNNPFYSKGANGMLGSVLELATGAFALMVPFTLMGSLVIFILGKWPEDVGLYYFANLSCSGLGCILAVVLLDHAGGLNAFCILLAIMFLSAGWYSYRQFYPVSVISLITGVLMLCFLLISSSIFPLRPSFFKPSVMIAEGSYVYRDWTSLSKLDIFTQENEAFKVFGLWGLSETFKGDYPERLGILIDDWAYTTVLKSNESPGYYDFLDYLPMYLVYDLAVDKPEVLIIGSGGGMDIKAALLNGADRIDAVEINPSIYKALRTELAAYSGNIYLDPPVTSHLAEGRRFLESTDKKYDIIQLSGVDTFSATQAGAFALSENFLYTTEAFQKYFSCLKEDGVLTLTRWYLPSEERLPRYSLRIFSLAVESMSEMGIKEPWKNILLIRNKAFTVILMKATPFSARDIATIEDEVNEKKYSFLYRPDKVIFEAIKFYSYIKAPDRQAFLDKYPFNVSPPTDDNPFYFENRKIKSLLDFKSGYNHFSKIDGQTILFMLFVEFLIISILLICVSWYFQRGKTKVFGWLYFFAIGMGFMLVEVTFSQQFVLFLGHPVYALSVVMFSILIFSGLGSLLSKNVTRIIPAKYCLYAAGFILVLQAVFGSGLISCFIGLKALSLRIIITILFLCPVSFLMGIALPEAVRRLTEGRHKTTNGNIDLGIYWAWNSIASVIASVLAIIIAIGTGFKAVMLIAGFCYFIAGFLINKLSVAE